MIKKFNSLKYILSITKCSLTVIMVVGVMNLVNFKELDSLDKLILTILLMVVIGFIVSHIRNDISFRTFTNKSRTEINLIGKKMITIKWYLKLLFLFLGVKDFLYDNLIFSENVVILNVFKDNKVYLDKVFIKKSKKTLIIEGLFLTIYTLAAIAFTLICIKYFVFAIIPVVLLLNGDNITLVHKPLRKLFL